MGTTSSGALKTSARVFSDVATIQKNGTSMMRPPTMRMAYRATVRSRRRQRSPSPARCTRCGRDPAGGREAAHW